MNLSKYLSESLTYEEYVKKLGNNLQLHMLHYKKFKLPEAHAKEIAKIEGCDVLILTEPWCGDSLASLPVLKKITEAGSGWNLKVLLRDQNLELINRLLTNGTRSIPLFLFLDQKGKLICRWGPRTKNAQNIFDSNLPMIMEGKISKKDVLKKIRHFYAKDCGQNIYEELMELLKKYQYKKHNYLGNKLLKMEVL